MEKEKLSRNPVGETTTVPVLEEELQVVKRTVDTGITKVSVKVKGRECVIDQPLRKDTVEVRRVPVDRLIESPVGMRTEGDTTIIPVMEEVLVVEKKLRLKEELHITRSSEIVPHTQKETIRREEVVVEHKDLTH